MDRTHPTTPRGHGNGPKAPNEPDDRKGERECTERTRTNPKTPRAHGNGPNAQERTRRSQRGTGMDRRHPVNTKHPGRTGMNRNYPNEPDAFQGERPNGPERPLRPQRRTGMNRTYPYFPEDRQGARESTERPRTNTNSTRTHKNGPNAPEGTRRPLGREGMERAQPNEHYNPQGVREWTERT